MTTSTHSKKSPTPRNAGRIVIPIAGAAISGVSLFAALPPLALSILFFDNFHFGSGFAHLFIFGVSVMLPLPILVMGVAIQLHPSRRNMLLVVGLALLNAVNWWLWMSPLAGGLVH